MPPMILPSTMIGTPPSSGVMPGWPRMRRLTPPWAMLLQRLGRPLEVARGDRLADRNIDAGVRHIVELGEADQLAAGIDDGDGDRPVVLLRLGLGRGDRLLGRVGADAEPVGRRGRRRRGGVAVWACSTTGDNSRTAAAAATIILLMRFLSRSPRPFARYLQNARGKAAARDRRQSLLGVQCLRLGSSGSGTILIPAASSPSRTAFDTTTAVGPSPCTQIESTWQGTRLPEVE
jgi:hypothetical protein